MPEAETQGAKPSEIAANEGDFTVTQKEDGDFEPIKGTELLAVCCEFKYKGQRENKFDHEKRLRKQEETGKILKPKLYHNGFYNFQVNEEIEQGEFAGQRKEFRWFVNNLSFGSPSHPTDYKKHLESWRDRPFSDQELKAFHANNVVGVSCFLRFKYEDGKDRPKLAAILPARTHCPNCVQKVSADCDICKGKGKIWVKFEPVDYTPVDERVEEDENPDEVAEGAAEEAPPF